MYEQEGKEVGVVRRQSRDAAQWRRLVTEYEGGRETLREFSARHGFSRTALEYWQRKFRSGNKGPSGFKEYRLAPTGSERAEVEVRLGNGRSVVVRGEINEGALRQILAIVGG